MMIQDAYVIDDGLTKNLFTPPANGTVIQDFSDCEEVKSEVPLIMRIKSAKEIKVNERHIALSKIRLTDSSERIKVKNDDTRSLSKGVSMEKIMQIAGKARIKSRETDDLSII